MNEHRVYPDELNKAGNRTKAGKNKQLAQEVGINLARKKFEEMKTVEFQPQNFDWDKYGKSLTSIACSSLFSYFGTTPKNITELEEITKHALTTEWSILLENARINGLALPIRELAEA